MSRPKIPRRMNRMIPEMRVVNLEETMEKAAEKAANPVEMAANPVEMKAEENPAARAAKKKPVEIRRKEAVSLDDLSGC